MQTRNAFVLVMLAAGIATADDKSKTWTFSKDDLGKTPAGWTASQTGKGKSVWKVVVDETAPSKSGYVLAQTTDDKEATFNVCVIDGSNYQDVEVTIAFKPNAGENDQGGGIVWRYVDANNYYIARMNPLEDNFRVYKVVDGKRAREFQNAEVKLPKGPKGEWHTQTIRMVGDKIECFVDGKKYLEAKDDTFAKAGKVGLWTKADAQTSFDQFQVKELGK
jgi:hypothetical protein